MNSDSISNMIDRKINESLLKGFDIKSVQKELNDKICRFVSSVKEEDSSLSLFRLLEIDPYLFSNARTKYQVMYIKECHKKIIDLEWVCRNEYKFPDLKNYQIFKLIKFKEKLNLGKHATS